MLVSRMESLFGIRLNEPKFIAVRSEIVMSYKTRGKVLLDISSSGRGQQQTLLLLAHMAGNPGSVLLLDEPDAHLEILRQRQIYQILSDTASSTQSQIIAASHSEVLLNEAADRDVVIAFVGKPHRIDDRGSQVMKALKQIGFEHYYQAEERGWVLYLEGSTDLATLRVFAKMLDHPAQDVLERPFVHYVGNQPRRAQEHFYGLREAKSDLVGIALYDRLEQLLPADPYLRQIMWQQRELENYLCQQETLMDFAENQGRIQQGDRFGQFWRKTMEQAIVDVETALESLGRPSPWGANIKASDDFLDPLFNRFYGKLDLPNMLQKTDYHTLASHVSSKNIDDEVRQKLDQIHETAQQANPRQE